jgi:hypothetical protein
VDVEVAYKHVSPGAATLSVDAGLGDHLGVSFNFSSKDGLLGFTGHLGISTPTPPVQGTLDVPDPPAGAPVPSYACGKTGLNC